MCAICGITGVLDYTPGAICQKSMGIFMQLLHAGAVRGMHGTGVFGVDREGSNLRVRAGGPPHALVGSKEFEKFEKFVGGKFVKVAVGHNRYATRGGISTECTHPFRDGNTILLHNGTLDSFGHLPDGKKFSVDSEALCHAFEVDGPEKTIKSLKGAWAIVWYDGTTKTVNFLRNDERPLYMAIHKKDPFIAFASEASMLTWILNRNGMYDIDVKELPENMWYSFTLDSLKPHVKELKGKGTSKSKEGVWEGWGKSSRSEASGSGKEVVQGDSKIIALPAPKKSSAYPMTTTGSSHATNLTRGNLQRNDAGVTKKGKGAGYWVKAEDLHDLYKDKVVIVYPHDYKSMGTPPEGKPDDALYQVKATSDEHPDIEFFINVRGEKNVSALIEAEFGIRGMVRTILRSMESTAKFPHQVHLSHPEPMYTQEPVVPSHAEVKH